ncbi:MAG: endonuclease/exonuclease/phosphatase family protein, partial [Candidatus Thiodiazotropha taylori]|nr:endonuclease/exonuclease/phosphatase family protein [Candidatus Thiodiazotropha taylori]MCW4307256.1 endonuclease/exonuclease/phosphatase family protein [Candidatus Thiodiazotropha endolucinida]
MTFETNIRQKTFNNFTPVNYEDKSFLSIIYANVDSGLLNKKDELLLLINEKNPDLMLFNEILPKRKRSKKKLSSNDFKLDGYDFNISSTTEGRGVIIYFKTCICVQSVEFLNHDNFEESVWLNIKLKGTDNLLVGNVYRSPSSSKDNNILLNLMLQKAMDLNTSHVLIVGDFNYGSLNWELQQSTEAFDQCSSLFMEKVKDLFLYQHVMDYTRHRTGQSPSRLDLIFSNEANMVSELDYMPPLGASDHACLNFNFTCYTDFKKSDEPRPNFFKGNYADMRVDISETDWDSISANDLNTYWENFLSIINTMVNDHVPMIRPSRKAKKQTWLNSDAIAACTEKKRAYKKWKFCKNERNWQLYAESRNKA